jgi:hypothetical protein
MIQNVLNNISASSRASLPLSVDSTSSPSYSSSSFPLNNNQLNP